MEMRDSFLKYLAQQVGYDTYPFGNPEKRVDGLYIKHNGDTAADAFCQYLRRLKSRQVSFSSKNQDDFTAALDMDTL